MTQCRVRLVLWTGPRHSGKSTAALRLAEEARHAGFSVAGLVAPALWEGHRLAGFDALDLRTGARKPLGRRGTAAATLRRCASLRSTSVQRVGGFELLAEGLALGRRALCRAQTATADLIIVDEFGPLELRGGGWRTPTDALVGHVAGLVVLVVRAELVSQVRRLYSGAACQEVHGTSRGGVARVIDALRKRRLARAPHDGNAARRAPNGAKSRIAHGDRQRPH